MSFEVPAVDTERLTLRGHRREDFRESAAMWGDPEVTRYIGGKPLTEEEAWKRLLRYAGHWLFLGFGYWVVREKASGRFVGEVGFADLRRAIEPGFDGAPEAGWVLAPWSHGRGYAGESVRAVLEWGTQTFEAARTVCLIDIDNERSIRLAGKCGYQEFARTEYHDRPFILFERRPGS